MSKLDRKHHTARQKYCLTGGTSPIAGEWKSKRYGEWKCLGEDSTERDGRGGGSEPTRLGPSLRGFLRVPRPAASEARNARSNGTHAPRSIFIPPPLQAHRVLSFVAVERLLYPHRPVRLKCYFYSGYARLPVRAAAHSSS